MSTHGLMPGGGVRLPLNVGGPPPIDPKYKAIILIFMFYAEQARDETLRSITKNHALRAYAHIVVSTLLNKVYGVDIHPDSIKAYHFSAIANVKKVVNWDQHAVAEIISCQVQDEKTFGEVFCFLTTVRKAHWNDLNFTEKFFIRMVSKATDNATYASLESYWLGAVTAKTQGGILIQDPKLPLSRGAVDLKTASDYGDFIDFENRLYQRKLCDMDD